VCEFYNAGRTVWIKRVDDNRYAAHKIERIDCTVEDLDLDGKADNASEKCHQESEQTPKNSSTRNHKSKKGTSTCEDAPKPQDCFYRVSKYQNSDEDFVFMDNGCNNTLDYHRQFFKGGNVFTISPKTAHQFILDRENRKINQSLLCYREKMSKLSGMSVSQNSNSVKVQFKSIDMVDVSRELTFEIMADKKNEKVCAFVYCDSPDIGFGHCNGYKGDIPPLIQQIFDSALVLHNKRKDGPVSFEEAAKMLPNWNKKTPWTWCD